MKNKILAAVVLVAAGLAPAVTALTVAAPAQAGLAWDQANRANQGKAWRDHVYDGRRRPGN